MTLLSFIIATTLILAPGGPNKGDNAAVVLTEFNSAQEAMEYVVKEVLLPMEIIPLRYDVRMGYLVTERSLYKGFYNCDYVFTFLMNGGKVQITCRPRDYDYSKSLDTFPGYSLPYNPKAMKDSPAKVYWDKFQQILSKIPSVSIIYTGAEKDNQIKDFQMF